VLCCVVAQTVPDISKDHRAFICTVKEYKKFSVILLLKKIKEKKNRITSQKFRCARRHQKKHIYQASLPIRIKNIIYQNNIYQKKTTFTWHTYP